MITTGNARYSLEPFIRYNVVANNPKVTNIAIQVLVKLVITILFISSLLSLYMG
jgi:hypothetical protein